MVNKKYGITKQAKPQFPVRELLTVPHGKNKSLILGFPAFGPNLSYTPSSYQANLRDVGKTYSHPQTGEQINFRPATTSESVSAVAYDFKSLAKHQIFDPKWLQAGYIVRTQDGVFTNTTELNESNLKQLLNGTKKTRGIYLINDQVYFIPYESFKNGIQDVDTFAEGGLARGLEHISGKIAPKLREIASPKLYKKGVNVRGFDSVNKPLLKVVAFVSGRYSDSDRLIVVGGDYWLGSGGGRAFGVLDSKKSK